MGEPSSPHQGTEPNRDRCTVRVVTSASVAAPVRCLAPALAAAAVLAFMVAGRAEGAERSWSTYLAPAGVCRAADDASAPTSAQVRAVACMLNWARAQDGRTRLVRRSALQQAAVLKGQRVASCRQFSHTPCGSSPQAGVEASGYRYAMFGENLFAGTWRRVSARDVVSAWLQSPPHRANVLSRRFQHVGVAPVRAPGLIDGADAVVWTATFASPR